MSIKNPVQATITGSNGEQDLRGKMADRPAATAVVGGTTYWAYDHLGQADEFTVSNGAAWSNF